jgi:hypothetical protein
LEVEPVDSEALSLVAGCLFVFLHRLLLWLRYGHSLTQPLDF